MVNKILSCENENNNNSIRKKQKQNNLEEWKIAYLSLKLTMSKRT